MFSCLIRCGEKTSRFFIFFFVFFFFSPKPGLRGGKISRCFSVLQKGLRDVSAESTGLVVVEGGRGADERRRRGKRARRGGGGGAMCGKERRRDRRYREVKVITETRSMANQLHRTGDGVASLKIQ